MKVKGETHVLGDDIDTDQIFPGEYLHLDNREDFGNHALEGYDAKYPDKIQQGNVIVAGENFGLGSSREAAPIALKYAGVGAVVAESFARIFYRNSINVGLPIAQVPGITGHVSEGDSVCVDFSEGAVRNMSTNEAFESDHLPPYLQDILDAGGFVKYRKQKE